MDGNFLDSFLMSKQHSGYTTVLFYASSCPFSQSIWPMYEALSSMFPQIDHLAVEQSSAMPRFVLILFLLVMLWKMVFYLVWPGSLEHD